MKKARKKRMKLRLRPRKSLQLRRRVREVGSPIPLNSDKYVFTLLLIY
jgi:hypothetical protein